MTAPLQPGLFVRQTPGPRYTHVSRDGKAAACNRVAWVERATSSDLPLCPRCERIKDKPSRKRAR